MKTPKKILLNVDVIGNQNKPLTEEEAQKLHAYFQRKKELKME